MEGISKLPWFLSRQIILAGIDIIRGPRWAAEDTERRAAEQTSQQLLRSFHSSSNRSVFPLFDQHWELSQQLHGWDFKPRAHRPAKIQSKAFPVGVGIRAVQRRSVSSAHIKKINHRYRLNLQHDYESFFSNGFLCFVCNQIKEYKSRWRLEEKKG